MSERIELAQNAAGRSVPTMVNGKPQIPFLGVAQYQPRGRKAAPLIAPARIIPKTATSAWPTSKPLCAIAACATAW